MGDVVFFYETKINLSCKKLFGVVSDGFLFFRLPLGDLRQPENRLLFCGWHPISFNHASRADGALTFLCFAKEK